MKFLEGIRRVTATPWLVAAPLVIVFGIIAILNLFAIVQALVERVFRTETADYFASPWFGASCFDYSRPLSGPP
jgi:hypothetical protein